MNAALATLLDAAIQAPSGDNTQPCTVDSVCAS